MTDQKESTTTKTWHAGDFGDLVCACTDGMHNDSWVASTSGSAEDASVVRDQIIADHAAALRVPELEAKVVKLEEQLTECRGAARTTPGVTPKE